MFGHIMFIFKFEKNTPKNTIIESFYQIHKSIFAPYFAFHIDKIIKILFSQNLEDPRKIILFPKTLRNQKMDSLHSPNPGEVKRLGNWKAYLNYLVYWLFGQSKMHHTLNVCPYQPRGNQFYKR